LPIVTRKPVNANARRDASLACAAASIIDGALV
jgi:hypothetical protein